MQSLKNLQNTSTIANRHTMDYRLNGMMNKSFACYSQTISLTRYTRLE